MADGVYHDDRRFVLDIGTAEVRPVQDPVYGELEESVTSGQVNAASKWTLTTRRNCRGYPPVRVDHFDTLAELVEYVRKVEPSTPRNSLDGKPPDPVPSYDEHLEWLEANGLIGAIEAKLHNDGYFKVPEWRDRLVWEAEQLADYLRADEAMRRSQDTDLDRVLLSEFSKIAKERHEEARAALAQIPSSDTMARIPAADMLRVCTIIIDGVTSSADELQLRSTIAALREAMSGGLDGAAFMTAENVIEVIRDILQDERLDTGTSPRTLDDAVRFIARTIQPGAKDRLRAALLADSNELRTSFQLGMSVRNTLRSGGFSEASLGVQNLDDVWYEILEAALLLGTSER